VEDDNPAPPDRRRLWVAVAATMVAVPLLLLDNLTADADDDDPVGTTSADSRAGVTVVVPLDRPETGPAKGISVVTSSTTSSTVPITVVTTTSTTIAS
jgi:hypothetical protein